MMVLSEVEFNFAVFSIKICLRLTHHNLHVYYMVLNVKSQEGKGSCRVRTDKVHVVFDDVMFVRWLHVELCSNG